MASPPHSPHSHDDTAQTAPHSGDTDSSGSENYQDFTASHNILQDYTFDTFLHGGNGSDYEPIDYSGEGGGDAGEGEGVREADDDDDDFEDLDEDEDDEVDEEFEEEDDDGMDEEEDEYDESDAQHDLEDIIENMDEDGTATFTGPAAALYYIITESGIFNPTSRQRRRPRKDPARFPKIPSDKGAELMRAGGFGADESSSPVSPMRSQKQMAMRILNRELGLSNELQSKTGDVMSQSLLPSSKPDFTIHYDEPVYSGQFSDDGNFFYSCVKDFKVRMYDTSNPYKWRYYKTVSYPMGRWTLTDAALSPDNRFLAYSSIHSTVMFASTDPNDKGEPYDLDLSNRSQAGYNGDGYDERFGIWSIRYNGAGTELVAGTSDQSVIVYDIESRQQLINIDAHDGDVNAVCFADKENSNILFSGSDDTTIKVWDRRSMGDKREAGAFIGHTQGVTYIDTKGDGRYCLSNGKDQSMKLWDLRTMMTTAQFSRIDPQEHISNPNFDYRWESFNENDWDPHPHDNSVVTFRGHQVLQTLIRCHFSPPGSSNGRYVYSGSADGSVYIYNLDATLAAKVDVCRGAPDDDIMPGFGRTRTCVRDASWHPNAPIIAGSYTPLSYHFNLANT